MDSYLDIAAAVLRIERRPLSSKAILAAAHEGGLVPVNLFGRTQHKTLGARISEDIVNLRDKSRFFRTAPGRYFLREFLSDRTVSEEYQRPFLARRRIRELARGPALAFTDVLLKQLFRRSTLLAASAVLRRLRNGRIAYLDPRLGTGAFVRPFVCVFRDTKVLSYRLGRYRDSRDSFLKKRTIGFSTFVHIDEHTLFSASDFGIVDAGVRAVELDLDVPAALRSGPGNPNEATLRKFLWYQNESGSGDVLAIIMYRCSPSFEPVKRRLALNDLEWVEISGINDLDAFDPWSKRVLLAHISERILGP